MTDELKDRFQQLVADPPPPTAVPSQAVFARVRTVRRRRTAGVALVAAAAVVTVALVASNLTEIDSSPPIANTPTVTVASPSVPAPPKPGVAITLVPTLKGRVLNMKVTVNGTVLVPLGADDLKQLPTNVGIVDLGLGSDYDFGDGSMPGGSDGGAITCQGAKTRKTGKQTYSPLDPHTYAKAGTYTFSYKISFCGGRTGQFTATKTAKIVVR
ncbi:hypothetical protein AB0P21_22010 [Kribbella sp. NPDC056861]|uniref:hypothetical protein n=1 Tax=Kribbella sp. NPDC056861 TaxID=3154857 RepID=UPI00342AAB48